MAVTTSGQLLKLRVSATLTNTLEDAGNKQATADIDLDLIEKTFTDGVSAQQINRAFEATGITLQQDEVLDVDLYDVAEINIGTGAGNDALGQSNGFAELVAFIVKKTGGSGRLEIQSVAPSDPVKFITTGFAADQYGGAMRTGGVRMIYAPGEYALPIVAGSARLTRDEGRNVRFKAVGGGAVFSLCLFGRDDFEESSSSSLSSSSSSSSSNSSSSLSSSSSSSYSSSSLSSQSSLSSSSSSSHSSSSSSQSV